MTDIRFGTDGWRGQIADDYTFDNVRAVAQATAEQMQRAGTAARGAVIGYDTRFLSASFAARAYNEALHDQLTRAALPPGPGAALAPPDAQRLTLFRQALKEELAAQLDEQETSGKETEEGTASQE